MNIKQLWTRLLLQNQKLIILSYNVFKTRSLNLPAQKFIQIYKYFTVLILKFYFYLPIFYIPPSFFYLFLDFDITYTK